MELLSIVLCVAALLLTSIFGLTLWITNEHYREAIARSLATPAGKDQIKKRQPPKGSEDSRLQVLVKILKDISTKPLPDQATVEFAVVQALTMMQSEAGTQNSRRIASYSLYKRLFKIDGTMVRNGNLQGVALLHPCWEYSNLYHSFGNLLRPNENCPICWDPIVPTQRTILHGQCRHSFHPECLKRHHQNAQVWLCPFDQCIIAKRPPPPAFSEPKLDSLHGIAQSIRACQEGLQAKSLDASSVQNLLLQLEQGLKRHIVETAQPPNAPAPTARTQPPAPAQQPALNQQRLIRIPQPVRPAVPAMPPQRVQPPQPAAPRQIAPHQQPVPAIARPAVPVLANPHVQIARPLVQAQPRAGPATPAQQPIRPAGIAQRPSIGAAGRAVQAVDRAPLNHTANHPQGNRQPKPKPPRPAWR